MKVEVKKGKGSVTFGSLAPGQVFYYNDTYWFIVDQGIGRDAYSLDKGKNGNFKQAFIVDTVVDDIKVVVG